MGMSTSCPAVPTSCKANELFPGGPHSHSLTQNSHHKLAAAAAGEAALAAGVVDAKAPPMPLPLPLLLGAPCARMAPRWDAAAAGGSPAACLACCPVCHLFCSPFFALH